MRNLDISLYFECGSESACATDRARHPAGRRLMMKTKIVHNLQAQYWLKVEKLQVELLSCAHARKKEGRIGWRVINNRSTYKKILQVARDELETIIARRERHALNCRSKFCETTAHYRICESFPKACLMHPVNPSGLKDDLISFFLPHLRAVTICLLAPHLPCARLLPLILL